MRKKKLIDIEEDLWKRVKALGNLKKISPSQVIENLIHKYIKEELTNAI